MLTRARAGMSNTWHLEGWNLSHRLSPRRETSHQIVGPVGDLAFFETASLKSSGKWQIMKIFFGLTPHSLGTVVIKSRSTDQQNYKLYLSEEGDRHPFEQIADRPGTPHPAASLSCSERVLGLFTSTLNKVSRFGRWHWTPFFVLYIRTVTILPSWLPQNLSLLTKWTNR